MKYNWSIIGHEKQLAMLEDDIASGNFAHAYLLAGPNSIGKYTVAKKLAGILQCENNFCHNCNTCFQIEKGCHIDTIDFSDDKESIKIETVRKLVERLNMSRQSPYKVVLIEKLERMTPEAANSFLKTLEEPPEKTVFIMTTDNPRLLLKTVLSRVRIVRFHSVSLAYLEAKLQNLYPECAAETLKKVGLFSLGRSGKALQLMENPEALANYLKVYRDIQNFLAYRNISERFSYVEELATESEKADLFLNMLIHVLRSKILEGAPETMAYIKILSKIDEAGMLLKKNVNVRLVLENLMLEL